MKRIDTGAGVERGAVIPIIGGTAYCCSEAVRAFAAEHSPVAETASGRVQGASLVIEEFCSVLLRLYFKRLRRC